MNERKKQVADIEKQLNVQINYSEVATWTFQGQKSFGGFTTPTLINGWWNGYVKRVKERYEWECNDQALQHYKTIINKVPVYPFPYLLLAKCLKDSGDTSWKEYAQAGLLHVQGTMQIAGRSIEHDVLYQNMLRLFFPDNEKKVSP